MKIAFIVSWTDRPGGVRRRLIRIYNELCGQNKNLSCDIILIGGSKTAKSDILFNIMDCPFENINILLKKRISCLFYLLFTNRYQLVHLWGNFRYYLILQIMLSIKGQKTLYTVCGYPEAYNLVPESQMKRFKKHLCCADYVDLLYPSAEEFVGRYVNGKLSITPGTFTDLNIFRPEKKKKILVYAAARLEENKDPMLLLRAVNLCKDQIRRNEYRVIVLGKGEHEEYMKSYILENKLNDIIDMAGYKITSEYLPSAEVFFSLQKRENYPSQSLAEAVACGCYSIITDVGDSRKCAEKGFASFVEGTDIAVAQAITDYFSLSEEEKRNVISLARQFAIQNYSIEKSKVYYLSLLNKACN